MADLIRVAHNIGYARALTLAAQRVDELDAVWSPIARPTYEQRVAARAAEMERFDVAAWLSRYRETAQRQADAAIAAGQEHRPAPCEICRPAADLLCCCAGVVTPRWPTLGRVAA